MAIALVLRLNNVGFGLPSLYDPDEPLFMVKAATLLSEPTYNPRWFGHPGSTTIYLTALIQALVFLTGLVTGQYAGVKDFIAAAYADPAMLFLPVRVVMALLGTACVALTYLLGRRLFGRPEGLLAAGFLALNGLHIAWSQVIRTDIHASVFMLAALLFAARLVRGGGRMRDAVAAGVLTGFAIATKWPAATVFVGIIGATAHLALSRAITMRRGAMLVGASGAATIAGLFLASPFVFIDYPTVLSNLSGEARPFHLGHTGGGFLSNLGTYLGVHAAESMGWLGLALALVGIAVVALRSAEGGAILLPATVAFFVGICAQHLIWSRWLLPGLPFLSLFAAVAVMAGVRWLVGRVPAKARPALAGLAAAMALLPSAAGALDQSRERANDTRAQAVAWVVANAPPGSRIVLEHLELKLRSHPFRFLFPIGRAGCLDGEGLLKGGVEYDDLQQARGASPIVDLGNVGSDRVSTCRADFAILTYYDLYLLEQARWPDQLTTYRRVLEGGHTAALFRPVGGRAGGPVVRIVALPPQKATKSVDLR
ncbi:glycosyltransferase family 39 protein [Sphingomonas sp. GCM10030256]|uniref:glycosyltransferase family 39 protein n=1 Tax=Sphingomonas sp. GCM10030256 TaxID=3273427 RepID=UPI00361B7DD1